MRAILFLDENPELLDWVCDLGGRMTLTVLPEPGRLATALSVYINVGNGRILELRQLKNDERPPPSCRAREAATRWAVNGTEEL